MESIKQNWKILSIVLLSVIILILFIGFIKSTIKNKSLLRDLKEEEKRYEELKLAKEASLDSIENLRFIDGEIMKQIEEQIHGLSIKSRERVALEKKIEELGKPKEIKKISYEVKEIDNRLDQHINGN